jgi:hypothetical protein
LNSVSAISAAFFIESATVPALPPADSGKISATRTPPVPTSLPACGGGAEPAEGGGCEDDGVVALKSSERPEHADSNANAPTVRPWTQARRDNRDRNWTRKPGTMTGYLNTMLAAPAHPSNPAS